MEAVPGIASGHVLSERPALLVGAALVGVADHTGFIYSGEQHVVVQDVFVNEFPPGERGNNSVVNPARLAQVGENTVHVLVGNGR